MIESNLYANAELGFAITKPDDWNFLPTQWALSFRKKIDPDDEELDRVMKLASVPFVYFHFNHGDDRFAYPTVQVTCRPLVDPKKPDRREVLELQRQHLVRSFENLQVIEATPDAIISGYPATRLVAEFRLFRNDGRQFHCRSRSYTVFVRRLGFTLGMSGPAKGPHQRTAQLLEVERSISIR